MKATQALCPTQRPHDRALPRRALSKCVSSNAISADPTIRNAARMKMISVKSRPAKLLQYRHAHVAMRIVFPRTHHDLRGRTRVRSLHKQVRAAAEADRMHASGPVRFLLTPMQETSAVETKLGPRHDTQGESAEFAASRHVKRMRRGVIVTADSRERLTARPSSECED
jgi:hypothetical protein